MTVGAGVGVKNISRGHSELNWNDSVIVWNYSVTV